MLLVFKDVKHAGANEACTLHSTAKVNGTPYPRTDSSCSCGVSDIEVAFRYIPGSTRRNSNRTEQNRTERNGREQNITEQNRQ